MGRMKEYCMQIIEANGGIPEGLTIEDVVRMEQMKIFEWQEYERQQEKNRLQFNQSENPGEIAKVEQTSKKFSASYGQAREEKGSEQ